MEKEETYNHGKIQDVNMFWSEMNFYVNFMSISLWVIAQYLILLYDTDTMTGLKPLSALGKRSLKGSCTVSVTVVANGRRAMCWRVKALPLSHVCLHT